MLQDSSKIHCCIAECSRISKARAVASTRAHHRGRLGVFLFYFWLWKNCRCAVWDGLQQGGAQPYANMSCRWQQHGAEGYWEKMLVVSGRRAVVPVSALDQVLLTLISAVLCYSV